MKVSPLMLTVGAAVLLGPACGLARPPARATTPCAPLVQHLRSWVTGHPNRDSGLDDLAPFARKTYLSGPLFDREDPTVTGRLGRSARLKAAVADLGDSVAVNRLGRTDIFVVSSIAGTADCESFVFIRRDRLAPRPPHFLRKHPDGMMNFCWNDSSWFGELGGVPVFAEVNADLSDPTTHFTIAAWRGDRWGPLCGVEMRFAPVYRVSAVFYASPMTAWRELSALAPLIARQRDRAPEAETFAFGAALGPDDSKKVVVMREAMGGARMDSLPTFGAEAPTYSGMDDNGSVVTFPLRIDGHVYLARLAHGSIGWRTDAGYLLSVWDLTGDDLTPLAGLVIDKTAGRLLMLKTTP